MAILLRCPSSPHPLPHLCDPSPPPSQRDPLLGLPRLQPRGSLLAPRAGVLFLLGLGPAGWPCADDLAWRHTLFSEPLWLPIKSCLTFLDGTNWILGDVNRGSGGGGERSVQDGTTGVMCVTLCVCTVGMCGAWGCRGASRVPAAAPSPQPAQRHTGFSQPVLQVPV